MSVMLMGTKLGMTRVFTEDGKSVPVTVIELGPCVVTQIRTNEKDGYSAVQIGYGAMKARNSTIPMIGHDAKAGADPLRRHAEFRCTEEEASKFELGQTLGIEAIEGIGYVDVIANSKGKGFAGVMKRYGFKGQQASHGVERKHRSPGSIGGHATNRGFSGKLKKGKRMSGRLGDERVTVRSLDVVRIDKDRNLLLVKGPVPGPNKSIVQVRNAVRLNTSKQGKTAGK
ncbi:MAG: 50S ribosomal protein L3 [Phycisphaeraceae bacterium]|nr:50S ribosomal protein L3 [Phycisphaeraceae bacterium]MCW5762973.1 50S ribosomal protein L3 [Phycisphaeraceae bacterium]